MSKKVVGFSLKTRRDWLDAALDQLTQMNDETKVRVFLDEYIKQELPGNQYREKSIGIVQRIWICIPPDRLDLRKRAIELVPRISYHERIWLHWGMSALAYPFFRDAAEIIGRLLSLQNDLTTAQIHDRMLTSWGDRVTTKDAVQRLIKTLIDWKVLKPTSIKGHFTLTGKMTSSSPDLELWLLHALLGASASNEIELQQLLRLPEAYPFNITVGLAAMRDYDGLNIHRQGLDMDMIAVRKERSVPPPPIAKNSKEVHKKGAKTEQLSLFDNQKNDDEAKNRNTQLPSIIANTR